MDALEAAVKEEDKKARALRMLTDLTKQRLAVERMSLPEAREAVAGLRKMALWLFPDKGHVFDLVIAPRMERVIRERWGPRAPFIN